jgi:uncharacterized protein (TIGR00369 family)
VLPVMDVEALTSFIDAAFPQVHHGGRSVFIEAVGPMTSRLRLVYDERHLRPGGTISGPAMFTLADLSLYVAVLAHIGPVGLAVTTSLTIDFLRRPEPRDLRAECRLLKLGKRLAVGVVTIFSDGSDAPVAHASGTYSIPTLDQLTVL